MRRFVGSFLIITLVACGSSCASPGSVESKTAAYSAAAVSLSDFSMKIASYNAKQNTSVPADFDAKQFFTLLEKIYPDQSRVRAVKENYRVSVRPLDGGYSVMLCDPNADRKIMEDLSCHLDRVEIRSWESGADTPCVFESNWKPYCQ